MKFLQLWKYVKAVLLMHVKVSKHGLVKSTIKKGQLGFLLENLWFSWKSEEKQQKLALKF